MFKKDFTYKKPIGKGFKYSFTIKELYVFLFKKKLCPVCSATVSCEKDSFQKVEHDCQTSGVSWLIDYKTYFYVYTCEVCNKKYTLSELASLPKTNKKEN